MIENWRNHLLQDMRKNGWCKVIALLPLLGAALLTGCSDRGGTPPNEAPPAAATTAISREKAAYSLSGRELRLLDSIAEFEKKALVRGEKTLLLSGIPAYSSAEIASTYQGSRDAGDQKFLGKTFIVRGEIISTGLTGPEPLVTLSGSSPVNLFRAYAPKYYKPKLSSLSQGQSVALACNGAGFAEGAAVCRDCMPVGDYAGEVAEEFKAEIRGFLAGRPSDRNDAPLSAVLVIALARLLPENSSCFSGGETCKAEITEPGLQQKLKKQAPAIKQELEKLGLEIQQ